MSTPPPIPQPQTTPATRLSPVEWQLIGGTIACALMAAVSSGLPAWLNLLALAIMGAGLALRRPFGLYMATFVLGGAMLIHVFRWEPFQDDLWPIDLLHALSLVGMIACGLSYLEYQSPTYRAWTRVSSDQVPVPPSENDWARRSIRGGRQSAFGQWWLMALVGFCLAVFMLWWYPYERIGPVYYLMYSPAVRLCRMFLLLFFPIWLLSSLLSIIAWQRISPIQAYVFNFRELHDEQGRDLVQIEKRVNK